MNRHTTIPFSSKLLLVILALSGIVLFSCKDKKKKEKEPNVLENKSIDVSVLSKRSGKDLLENLYDELEERSEELQQLEAEMEQLQKMTGDSISLFNRYDNKSQVFYDAAIKHAATIQDSLLRKRMQNMIDSSMMSYKRLIASDTLLTQQIFKSQASLKDLYTILKIAKTLPIMEQYQKDYLPADSMWQSLLRRYDALLTKTDSLARKP